MAKLIPAPPIVGPPPPPTVTNVTMSGPTSGVVSVASANFNVGVLPVGGVISGSLVVTPVTNASGTFSPTSVTLTTGSPTGVFTYTPSGTGTHVITVTNNGGLFNPSPISYVATASATVPNAPLIGFAQTGYSFVDVYFNAPSSDGGSSIIDYYAVLSTGENATGTGSPIRINVPNGAARSATVRARNAIGNSSFSGTSNVVTPPPTTLSFLTSQSWVVPAGVTNLISVTGKGQDGTPATSGTAGTPTNRGSTVVEVVYSPGIEGTSGRYYWNYVQADPTNAAYVINGGGSGTFTTTYVETDPAARVADARYNLAQSYGTFANSIPGSASVVYSAGWQTTGVISNSATATVNWQEYGAVSPGTPATTGANTVGFGVTWAGGVGGTAATTAYNNISVTPGASYGLTVPSGGSIIITY